MTAVDVVTGEVVAADEPTLAELEATIERGLESFLDVGNALLAIKAGRRYREAGFATFEAYCMERWNISRSQGHRLVVAAATVEALERDLSPIGDIPMPTAESQARPLAKLPTDEDRRDAWTDAVEQAESEGRSPTARDVERAVERRQPVKTTVTERITETRQTVTEPSPGHPAAPADERSEVEGSSSRPPSDRTSDDDTEAINRGFRNAVDPDLDYRKRFTDALTRAHDVTQFDADRAIATGGESAGTNRHLVKSLADWCDAYLKATRPTHLRSAK